MFDYFLGNKNQAVEEKIVKDDISDMIKKQVKAIFCGVCGKNLATKVAFGKEIQPVFTCAGCELAAVGGVSQRLGPKNLIKIEKYIEILTREIIGYQLSVRNTPVESKKSAEECKGLRDKCSDLNLEICEEYKKMRKYVKEKEDHLVDESNKQNNVLIFEDVIKMLKENQINQVDNGNAILKRALCNNKGLHFSDEEAISQANKRTNEKFDAIKKESKVKLKPLEDLIAEINNLNLSD